MNQSAKKPRVFLDANILLSGNAFARWPYEILQHALNGDIQLVLSSLVVKEARGHIEKRFPQHLARLEKFINKVDYELVLYQFSIDVSGVAEFILPAPAK